MRTRTFSGFGEIFIIADSWATETAGRIQDRTQEHLGTIDRAIIAMHHQMLEAIRDVQEGRDPPHVIRSSDHNDMGHMLVGADPADPAMTLAEYRHQANLRRGPLTHT
jgi:hypothetical protein